jgi:ADP-ribose pyrophosphatase YjhB (NUDIX family)
MTKSRKLLQLLESGPKHGAGILFRHANEVFLVKHKKLNKWVTPGGMHESVDKDLQSTAIREMREECGMMPGYSDMGKSATTSNEDGVEYTTFMYQPDHKFSPTELQKDEITEAAWFQLDGLPKGMYEHTMAAMDKLGIKEVKKPTGWK